MISTGTPSRGSSMRSNRSRLVLLLFWLKGFKARTVTPSFGPFDPLSVVWFQMFKGPNQDIEAVFTAPVSAVCGVTLDVNGKKEYLISGVYNQIFYLFCPE